MEQSMSLAEVRNPKTVKTAHSLRTLYFVRVIFSVIWVALIFILVSTVTVASGASVLAGVLLVIYPIWDVVATVFDVRASRGAQSTTPQLVNIVIGTVAALAMIVALISGLTAAIVVFGAWASVSGAIQLFLALRRRRALGAQWPMIISGALSLVAGFVFIASASSPKTGLATLAGYSAFGAFWYLIAAIALTRSARSRSAAAGS
jgi:uncharacterized membrane protein HdeD (DUF308 family)